MNVNSDIYITLDLDWASDEIIEFTLDILEKENICATIFITHYTKLLDRMRSNSKIELGIHPNFNKILSGETNNKCYINVIEEMMKIVPEAKSTRSHSITQNSSILNTFSAIGIKYDVNTYLPIHSGITMRPWVHSNNKLIRVPYFWEDDVQCLEFENGLVDTWNPLKWVESQNDIKVFNFHPIHLFLNTENMDRYEKSRNVHRDFEMLSKYVNSTVYGTRDFFRDLIRYAELEKFKFCKICNIGQNI